MKTSGGSTSSAGGTGGGTGGGGGGKKSEQKLKRILKKQFSNVIDPCPLINSTYWLPLLHPHLPHFPHQYHHHHHPLATVSLPSAAAPVATSGPIMSPTTKTTAMGVGSPTQASALLSPPPSTTQATTASASAAQTTSSSIQQQSICDVASETGTEHVGNSQLLLGFTTQSGDQGSSICVWGRNEIKGCLEDAGGVPVVVIDNDRKECWSLV